MTCTLHWYVGQIHVWRDPVIGRSASVDGLLAAAAAVAVLFSELRRHKRAFLKLATKIMSSRLQDPAAAQRLFVEHLRLQINGAAS